MLLGLGWLPGHSVFDSHSQKRELFPFASQEVQKAVLLNSTTLLLKLSIIPDLQNKRNKISKWAQERVHLVLYFGYNGHTKGYVMGGHTSPWSYPQRRKIFLKILPFTTLASDYHLWCLYCFYSVSLSALWVHSARCEILLVYFIITSKRPRLCRSPSLALHSEEAWVSGAIL